jgi:hypothetical protein
MKILANLAKVLGLVALTLGPVPVLLMSVAGLDAAHADSSKGNGNGNGIGNKNHDKDKWKKVHKNSGNGNGKVKIKADVASELKGMNAVRANPNALINANPDSEVGRIAAYRDAALITQQAATSAETALADLVAARQTLAIAEAMPALTTEEIVARDAAIAAPSSTIIEATTALAAADDTLATATIAEDAALLRATDGRILSPEALAYVRQELGL